MFKNIQLKLTSFAENHRPALWVLLLLLTLTILLFPTQLELAYHPIQSVYLFDNLPLFGSIFCIWVVLLVLLILTGENEAGFDWEKMGLVCIASMVFVAFWAIILPYGRLDYLGFAAQVETVRQIGNLSSGALYWDFPALTLLGTSLREISNLTPFTSINLSLLFFPPIIASLLYLLFKQVFKNTNIAAFASLLVLLGNMYLALAYTFHPNIISFVLLLAFLLVLTRNQRSFPEIFILLILMTTVTMLYFQTSVLFPLILLGLYIVQRIGKTTPITISIIILFIIIPAAWEMYATVRTFGLLSNYFSRIASSITEGTFLNWFFFLVGTNTGTAVPLWATLTRMFWWALIYGMGTILGIINLFNIKKLSRAEKVITGGLIGTIILIILATIASPGGERFTQYLQYAAFFTVPPLLYFFLKPGRIRRIGLTLLVVATVVLSFPSFLAHNGDVMTETSYSYEMSAGEFLNHTYRDGSSLYVVNTFTAVFYYIPKATHVGGAFWAPVAGDIFMQSKDVYVDDFLRRPGDFTVFLQHNRPKVSGEGSYGISSDDPRWQQMDQKLENGYAQRIYSNGYVQIWKPPLLH